MDLEKQIMLVMNTEIVVKHSIMMVQNLLDMKDQLIVQEYAVVILLRMNVVYVQNFLIVWVIVVASRS
jgi:hypothetical protein